MPDENGTEATRPDAPSADESLFGDAAKKAEDTPRCGRREGGRQGQRREG